MISYLYCIDIHKEYFDEIDEDSIFTRNEECKHFEISMRRISENFKFKKYSLTIECKNCNYSIKKNLTKNEDNISYYCEKCNMPQICINFVYQNTMAMDEESNNLKKEKNNNIEESSSNRSTEYNSQIQSENGKNSKVFSTLPENPDQSNVSFNPVEQAQNEKNKKAPKKVFYTPATYNNNPEVNNTDITKNIYNTPEQKLIEIIFMYNKKAKISLDMFEPLERQCGIIKKTFNIKNEKNINIIENSDVIDLQKSPKDLNWTSGMEMEIEINN